MVYCLPTDQNALGSDIAYPSAHTVDGKHNDDELNYPS